jgi:hypothetical protein
LERNKNEFLSGSWFTDTYQYTHNRYENLNPHNLSVHCDAYLNYLQQDEVKQQHNYEQLAAFLFGSLAHTTEDFWLDNLLYDYPKTIGENVTGDTYNGVMSIKKFGYLCQKVIPFFPSEDLYKMYTNAGIFNPVDFTPEEFKKHYKALISKQYEQLRMLKFLSFLASNQVQNKSPWMTANIMTVTGGMLSSVNNSARYLEYVWEKLNNIQKEGVLNVEYSSVTRLLGVLVAYPDLLPNSDSLDIIITNSKQDTIKGGITAYSKGGTITNLVIVVYQLTNDVLNSNEEYNAILLPKNSTNPTYRFLFRPNYDNIKANYPLKPVSNLSTFRSGLFLFIICLGLGGVFWGFPGLFTLTQHSGHKVKDLTNVRYWLKMFLQLVGILILSVGIYLLLTKGWLVVMNV